MRAPLVCLRELSAEETAAVESLARSRTAAARRVERARIVWRASQGETPPSIAEALSLSAETVRRRIRRFNAEGLAALEDHYRSGRPATYLADAVATVIAAALTSPQRLGLLFAAWTLDRLAAYLNLIEPWWKVLRSLALAGRRFETWDEVTTAIAQATDYWNAHGHPFIWGQRRRHRHRRQPGIALLPKAA